MCEEANNQIPMICFLSMGSDPTNNIEKLAKKKNISKSLKFFSYKETIKKEGNFI